VGLWSVLCTDVERGLNGLIDATVVSAQAAAEREDVFVRVERFREQVQAVVVRGGRDPCSHALVV
jgi:hypothetical protein